MSHNLNHLAAQQEVPEVPKVPEVPQGFRFSVCSLPFYPLENPSSLLNMSLSLISMPHPSPVWAACCSQNVMVSDSIKRIQSLLARQPIQALLINNTISNVGIAGGMSDIETLANQYANIADIPPEAVLPISTGIIGWRLPIAKMVAALPALHAQLGRHHAPEVAHAIMTTDRYPKMRGVAVGGGHILGIVKGAGMIEPNMATMLAFFLTDLAIPAPMLRRALQEAVRHSFNCISVDADQSTSDVALCLSSGMQTTSIGLKEFTSALTGLAINLAQDIVKNGEGVRHSIELTIAEAPSHAVAVAVGRAILRSRLVATAIYGNDPNVGRIIAALGSYAHHSNLALDMNRVTLAMHGHTLFEHGAFALTPHKEKILTGYLRECTIPAPYDSPPLVDSVKMSISLGLGAAAVTVWGGDLTEAYIKENTAYRS